MAKLILLNGAPGSGKSTLASRYASEHPLTLALDIDAVRGMLGGWLEAPTEAGQLARHIALEMARVHVQTGRDVVVPQFLGRLQFVEALAELCDDVGVELVEVALLSSRQDAAERFARRSADPETAEHRDACTLVERSGGLDALPEMYDRLLQVVASRPGTRILVTVEGQVEQTYQGLLTQLAT